MSRFAPILVFLIFSALVTVLLLHEKPDVTHSEARQMPLLNLTMLSGTEAQVQFYDGITVVNFFASWCTPCLAEHKELMILQKQFPDVSFNGIAWNDSKENIEKMLKDHGNPYDAVWLDTNGSSAVALGLRGVPETYIVKNGSIIYHLAGPILEGTRKNEIEALLAQ